MFPGGLDPETAKRLKDAIQSNMSAHESFMQNLVQSGALRRQEEHYAALQQALQNIPPISPEVMRSWQAATEMLNSPGFLERSAQIVRTDQLAEQRFGPAGLVAAQQIAARQIALDRDLEPAVERIRSGHAAEVLDEAVELVSSPEARQTIEQADEETLVELAQQQAEQDSRAHGREIRAGLDVETVIASAGEFSEGDIQALAFFTLQLVRVLVIVVSLAAAGFGTIPLETALKVLGGTLILLEFIKAMHAFIKGDQ